MRLFYCFVFTFLFSLGFSQENDKITLEDLWMTGKYWASYVDGFKWMNNGDYYTTVQDKRSIQKFNVITKKNEEDLLTLAPVDIDDYEFSKDESKILISSSTELIYRYSSKAKYFVYDINTKKFSAIHPFEKIRYATFSPNGKLVAFVSNNNLFIHNLENNEEKQITNDGVSNEIINGASDWVYEEELELVKAFFWSPDSKHIAYYRFDESKVKEYNIEYWNDQYPKEYKFKYPKAGEVNSQIKLYSYRLSTEQSTLIFDGDNRDIYLPRMKWTNTFGLLSYQVLNRLQNRLELHHHNVISGVDKIVLTEKSLQYVEADYDLYYLENESGFIWSSDLSGFNQLYYYDMQGGLKNQITKGNWEITEFHGFDEATNKAFFTSTQISPLQRNVFSISLQGKGIKQLTKAKGTHKASFSKDFKYFFNTYSTINKPPVFTVVEAKNGKTISVLESNKRLEDLIKEQRLNSVFFDFSSKDEKSLNGWIIKPRDFDESKKYPVLMYVYGGPGSQTVTDEWMSINYFWFQMLAEQGYIVVSVDGRGTGGRGAEFKKSTYANLGKYELEDQLKAAKYVQSLSYVDKERIGIWGWSFGGYMTLLGLTKGGGIFKMGIAVAPVTNWKFYDTIYTERYLKRPSENEEGYEENSPINFAGQLEGKLLLVHGTADDNVHVQNSYMMDKALVDNGIQFDLMIYPNKNHGIYGGLTRYHLYKLMSDFIKHNL